ncbi:MAG: response regulator transcription factor [Desulfobacterales bacterium]|nr:response regulator transcription factor [Desulfobacterales bacterium]
MKRKASVLVVEDDPSISLGLMDVLVFHGYAVTGSADGEEALEIGLNSSFDLIILDVMLPNVDGFTICRKIRKKKPGQGIIMLTAKGSEDDIITGFKSGADDYVCKPFSLRELMVRVEAVLRRTGTRVGDEQIAYKDIFFDGKTLIATYKEKSVELTRREMDLIVYLYRNQDRIVSKKTLLIDVWNYADADIETRTVDIHILKLRKKLSELAPDIPLIHTVRGQGYRLEPGL